MNLLQRTHRVAIPKRPRLPWLCPARLSFAGAGCFPKRPEVPEDVQHPKPPLTNWVSDAPDILGEPTRQAINDKINRLHDKTGAQIAVVLLENIGGHQVPVSQYEKFSVQLFDKWGVGRQDIDDGVLLALFREGRRIEVVTGKGVRRHLTDRWLADMQRESLVPYFKRSEHALGVALGVELIVARLEAKLPPLPSLPDVGDGGASSGATERDGFGSEARRERLGGSNDRHVGGSEDRREALSQMVHGTDPKYGTFGSGRAAARPGRAPPRVSAEARDSGWSDLRGTVYIIAAVALACVAIWQWEMDAEKQRRKCTRCGNVCEHVPSWLDDDPPANSGYYLSQAGLASAQLNGPTLSNCEMHERRLRAASFELLRCDKCERSQVSRRERWRSSHSRCDSCGCKTSRGCTRTLVDATEYQEGQRQVCTAPRLFS